MAEIYSLSSNCSEFEASDDEQASDCIHLNAKTPRLLSEILEAFKLEGSSGTDSTAIKQLMEVVESGSEYNVQTLYEGRAKCPCCKNWVEEYPGDLKSSIKQANENKKKALIVRMAKNHGDGNPLMLHSVVVQNQVIKDLLAEVFHGYNGITTGLNKLVFRAPFRPFYYRWKLFAETIDRYKKKGHDAAPFAQLLYNIIELELRETMDEIEDLKNNLVITYQHLWAIFEPGVRVYSSYEGHDRFFLVESCQYVAEPVVPHLAINVKFIDWDGSRFGYASTTLQINAFSGTKAIADLSTYPAKFHPYKEEVEKAAMTRGKKFCSLSGLHYKAYSGMITYHEGPDKIERNVDGRMIVDAFSFSYMRPQEPLYLVPLDAFSLELRVEDDLHCLVPPPPPPPGCTIPMGIHPPNFPPPPRFYPPPPSIAPRNVLCVKCQSQPARIGFPRKNLDGYSLEPKQENLTDEQLLLCNSRVRGFSLKAKVMATFDVDPIKEIAWNDSAFPNLVLPAGYRDLVLTFVDRQTTSIRKFDDFIEGKGLGLTMLLVGNPGTGKTLTAEAIADKVRRPLYVLSASELGSKASTVENRLQSALDFTRRWEAVLLLDECDVFLEKRSTNSLTHNEIVSVFLRMVEYYPGILFLTSNRPEAIDPAFQSRVHLTLHYPDLDAAARKQIWKQFVKSSAVESSLTEDQFTGLSMLPLNGRQIKNIVKISLLLVEGEGTRLTTGHIQTVLRATNDIDFGKFEEKEPIEKSFLGWK
ncbi:P-loop containing nucleoside triphosphate hydrolase protein [Ilyonectria robusta]|uniref:P-loop containing nucleoside triphosphate hydrolase protein n=1 Tax=Ilyonectria robusta TaxID=1079257 RepID=UPI001E8E4357|nr:P-loop containing nucleoside triphosphate hydrolase protein [Ilyonectria robusta]KAH8688097.1 P-loop containing nucleoside triphosphate hydrolase protein [Ilyonectria robusta]